MEKPESSRIEALTDGVFAIVLTLLVLELSIPVISEASRNHDITRSLMGMWHTYISYVMSFVILGLFWLHHTALYKYFKNSDGRLAILNLFFLMFVSLIPFSSSLVAHYWDEQISAILYGISWLLPFNMNIAMFSYAAKAGLLNEEMDPGFIKKEKISGLIVSLVLLLGIGLSFISSAISFALYGLMAIYFLINAFIGKEGLQARKSAK